eukprot:9320847-Lingulodinium_polyedra.AAC.1
MASHFSALVCAQHGAAMGKTPDHAVAAQSGQLAARAGKRRRVQNVHEEREMAIGLAAPGLPPACLPLWGCAPLLE